MFTHRLGIDRWSDAVAARLLDLSMDLACVAGYDGYFRELSDDWPELLGYSREELTSRPLLEFMHPDDAVATAQQLQNLRDGADVRHFEQRFVARDGSTRWLAWTAIGIPDEQAYRAVARDLTPEHLAEQAMGDSEQRYADLIQSSHDIVQSITPDGHFSFVNRAWHEHLGYTPEELPGLTLMDIVVEADHDHCSLLIRQMMTGQSFDHVEVTFVAKDGHTFPVEGNATGRFRDGVYIATHTFFRDVSDRKRSEALAAAYQRQLEEEVAERTAALVRSEKLATLGRLSAGMAHELNNPASAAHRGAVQLRDAIARAYAGFTELGRIGLSEADAERLTALIAAGAQRAAEPTALDPLTRSDREERIEQWLGDHGVTDGWTLAAPLAALDLHADALDELAASVQPAQLQPLLTVIAHSYSAAELLEQIGHGASRISQIVNALKGYSFMDRAPVQDLDVHEGLDNTLVMLQAKLRAGIEVDRRYGTDVPRIDAIGSELNQVWTNLIDNAVDAMHGTGHLTIRTSSADDGVLVEIEDDGPGIPPEIVGKVFDPFFTTKGPGHGTGLGLNISFNIIRGSGGTIDVDSHQGRTVFRVHLPLRRPEATDTATTDAEVAATEAGAR
ncbi:PAS domain S-box protein [Microbacterium sp. H1-D42]|uniref:PAS domain S-box protein n=1 Tax=Microbacterium sp. H1-D42 TaxID=2925844 RepID=UPI001F533F9E|nr:PAS domain S-box protein [Microbacterium sp. H1-D42]UNK71909.1 PAS domain S-box protein [Microbacterium sp. H1-D42]